VERGARRWGGIPRWRPRSSSPRIINAELRGAARLIVRENRVSLGGPSSPFPRAAPEVHDSRVRRRRRRRRQRQWRRRWRYRHQHSYAARFVRRLVPERGGGGTPRYPARTFTLAASCTPGLYRGSTPRPPSGLINYPSYISPRTSLDHLNSRASCTPVRARGRRRAPPPPPTCCAPADGAAAIELPPRRCEARASALFSSPSRPRTRS